MKIWHTGYEFKHLSIGDRSTVEGTLNELGKNGWRVVGTGDDRSKWYFTLEREYMEKSDE